MAKEQNRKPTMKQIRAAKLAVENGGNISRAMIDAGYSEATAKNPSKLTESKAWESLISEYFPDDYVAKIHKRLLEKEDIMLRNNNKTGKIEKVSTEQPHSDVKGALDMIYKLKGSYKPEKKEISGSLSLIDLHGSNEF